MRLLVFAPGQCATQVSEATYFGDDYSQYRDGFDVERRTYREQLFATLMYISLGCVKNTLSKGVCSNMSYPLTPSVIDSNSHVTDADKNDQFMSACLKESQSIYSSYL